MPQSATQPNRNKTARTGSGAPPAMPSSAEMETEDHVYGLISVLYHSLQGAQTYDQYVADAERAGDDELLKFFEECRDQETERATRAKALLGSRIQKGAEAADADYDDEDDEE